MKRFVIFTAAVLGLALFTTAPAYASHDIVQGEIDVFHGTTNLGSYFSRSNCTATSCAVTVTVPPNRDYHRFLRWCSPTGTDTVTIASGQSNGGHVCTGPSTWEIVVSGSLFEANFDPATHPTDVNITITVTT
jgi:hypothetical protein